MTGITNIAHFPKRSLRVHPHRMGSRLSSKVRSAYEILNLEVCELSFLYEMWHQTNILLVREITASLPIFIKLLLLSRQNRPIQTRGRLFRVRRGVWTTRKNRPRVSRVPMSPASIL